MDIDACPRGIEWLQSLRQERADDPGQGISHAAPRHARVPRQVDP